MPSDKVAFLFLVLDNPNFPNVWDAYFKGHEEQINIYLHPKYPKKNTWRQKCVIPDLQETGWGYIVSAYIALLTKALEDPKNEKFIFVSESCLPVKPFNEMFSRIMANKDESFVKQMNVKRYDLENRITPQIKDTIKSGQMIKHYARMCLSRQHVKQLLYKYNEPIIKLFKTMHVGDEFFLSSISPMKNLTSFAVTFDDWGFIEGQKTEIKSHIRSLYEKQETDAQFDCTVAISALQTHYNDIAKSPKTIYRVSQNDLEGMKKTRSFFYRKFAKNSDVEQYIYDFIQKA
jgi:hypothetical protein